jgi:hypothetical protein
VGHRFTDPIVAHRSAVASYDAQAAVLKARLRERQVRMQSGNKGSSGGGDVQRLTLAQGGVGVLCYDGSGSGGGDGMSAAAVASALTLSSTSSSSLSLTSSSSSSSSSSSPAYVVGGRLLLTQRHGNRVRRGRFCESSSTLCCIFFSSFVLQSSVVVLY